MQPIFLHRTLSYMKGRCTRNHTKRKTFNISSMLENKTSKSSANDLHARSKFMALTFLGFYDSKGISLQ